MIRDLFFGAVFIAAIFLVVLGAAVGVGAIVESYQCDAYERATGKPTKYVGLECYVKDGQWYAWAEYKHRLVTKGELK